MNLDKMKMKNDADIIENKLQSACFGRTPVNLAMKTLALYDVEVKKKKKTRKFMMVFLVSLIPVLAVLLGLIFTLLDYDLSTILSWIFQGQTVTVFGYMVIVGLSVSVMYLLGKRIMRMRKSVNSIDLG